MAEDRKLTDRIKLLASRAPAPFSADEFLLLEQLLQMMTRLEAATDDFSVTNIVSRATGQGKLDVVWRGTLGQLDAVKAREIAWMLLEGAAVAESEAMLMKFVKDVIGVPPENATGLLNEFRRYRQQADQRGEGSLVGDGPKH